MVNKMINYIPTTTGEFAGFLNHHQFIPPGKDRWLATPISLGLSWPLTNRHLTWEWLLLAIYFHYGVPTFTKMYDTKIGKYYTDSRVLIKKKRQGRLSLRLTSTGSGTSVTITCCICCTKLFSRARSRVTSWRPGRTAAGKVTRGCCLKVDLVVGELLSCGHLRGWNFRSNKKKVWLNLLYTSIQVLWENGRCKNDLKWDLVLIVKDTPCSTEVGLKEDWFIFSRRASFCKVDFSSAQDLSKSTWPNFS